MYQGLHARLKGRRGFTGFGWLGTALRESKVESPSLSAAQCLVLVGESERVDLPSAGDLDRERELSRFPSVHFQPKNLKSSGVA